MPKLIEYPWEILDTDFAKDQNKTDNDLQMTIQCRSENEPARKIEFFIYGGVMLPITIAFMIIIFMGFR